MNEIHQIVQISHSVTHIHSHSYMTISGFTGVLWSKAMYTKFKKKAKTVGACGLLNHGTTSFRWSTDTAMWSSNWRSKQVMGTKMWNNRMDSIFPCLFLHVYDSKIGWKRSLKMRQIGLIYHTNLRESNHLKLFTTRLKFFLRCIFLAWQFKRM